MLMPWFRIRRHDDRPARRRLERRRRFLVEPLEGRQMLSTVIVGGTAESGSGAPTGSTTAISGQVVVSNTADSGTGSLRQAIITADANTSSTPTTIDFDIPGAYLHTISLQSSLPTITEPVIIDGTSQPGYAGTPLITVDGSGAGSLAVGFDLIASNSTIKGLAIDNFSADGVLIYEGSNDVVTDDFIGLTTPGPVGPGTLSSEFVGNTPAGNGLDGVSLEFASGDTVSDDVISANGENGVYLFDASSNTLSGDFIGTDSAGYAARPNQQDGVLLAYGSANNTIGGIGAGDVISSNGQWGVYLTDSGTKGNVVAGDEIGTNAPGNAALPNGNNGVDIVSGASYNTVGGTVAGSANVISGNAYNGVVIAFAGASDNLVEGNLIGTNASGTSALPNGANGVEIQGGATDNTVGGTTAAERNLISGNGSVGVLITDSGTSGNVIEGDYIGTNAAGTLAVPNASDGVLIQAGASVNEILYDTISGDGSDGVFVNGPGTAYNDIFYDQIGTNSAGTAAVIAPGLSYSNFVGVQISDGAYGTVVAFSTISDNVVGVEIDGSYSNNGIYFSTIASNLEFGVFLNQTSGNEVYGNAVDSNGYYGILYWYSTAGQDSGNSFYGNGYGNDVTL